MYNLIITAQEGAWDGQPYELDTGRAIINTDEDLQEKYGTLDSSARTALQSFPTLFAYEKPIESEARIGLLTSIGKRSKRIRLGYKLFADLPPVPAAKLIELAGELDFDKWEATTTHWAVKRVDIFAVLIEAGLLTAQQVDQIPSTFSTAGPRLPNGMVVAPKAFRVSGLRREPDLVSVMMPFAKEFDPVYAAISRACREAGLRSQRADDVWQDSVIIQDIFNLLVRSSIVVADFSFRNPNAMYETGIAHTLGRPVVPLSQASSDVPFDLRHHRFLQYYPNVEGLATLERQLADRLRTLKAQDST